MGMGKIGKKVGLCNHSQKCVPAPPRPRPVIPPYPTLSSCKYSRPPRILLILIQTDGVEDGRSDGLTERRPNEGAIERERGHGQIVCRRLYLRLHSAKRAHPQGGKAGEALHLHSLPRPPSFLLPTATERDIEKKRRGVGKEGRRAEQTIQRSAEVMVAVGVGVVVGDGHLLRGKETQFSPEGLLVGRPP